MNRNSFSARRSSAALPSWCRSRALRLEADAGNGSSGEREDRSSEALVERGDYSRTS